MKLSWTPTARLTYFEVIDHLKKTWTEKEIVNFVNTVEKVLKQICDNPYMFKTTRKQKNVRKGFVTKYNTIYYRVKPRKKELELITFWDNRQNPKKMAY